MSDVPETDEPAFRIDECEEAFVRDFLPYRGSPDPFVVWRAAWKSCRAAIEAAVREQPKPIDMVLHCPRCGMQHIDAPDPDGEPDFLVPTEDFAAEHARHPFKNRDVPRPAWSTGGSYWWREHDGQMGIWLIKPDQWHNPPHRSHLCHGCGFIWRPADVPTNGVAAIKTKGKNDSAPQQGDSAVASEGGSCVNAELLAALVEMEREKSDYMLRNHLGNPAQEHTNKMARAAIAKAVAALSTAGAQRRASEQDETTSAKEQR